jgi:hypothetical protein
MSAIRTAICKFLQADSQITAIAAGGVWPTAIAPEKTPFPFLTVWPQTPPTAEMVFQEVACERAVYVVKATDKGSSPKRATELARLIRTKLDRAALVIDGYNNLGIVWIQEMPYLSEEYQGQMYQHEGGLYEIYAEAV